jgi:hypothetical protein
MLSGQLSPLWQMLVIDFWSLQKEQRLDEDTFPRPLEDQGVISFEIDRCRGILIEV